VEVGVGCWLRIGPTRAGRELGCSKEKGGSTISFYFRFFFSKAIVLNQFEFESNPINTKGKMHQHECTKMLLSLMINFNLIKNFISLCFHEHKNT
jgi:hypothetical protein